MLEAENSVTVARPVGDVFAFVADGENARQWRPGVLDVAKVSGEGAGAVYTQGVRGPGGRRVAADYRISAFELNRLIEFEAIAGPVRPRGRFRFEGSNGDTHVTFHLEADVTGLKKLLIGRMVERTMQAEVGALANLKRVLEA